MRGWSSITIWTGTLPLHITRTCGDDPVLCSFFFWDSIYYPHMRGWSWLEKIRFYPEIILPAHAGMILTIWLSTHFAENITRTCGDDPESRNDTDLSYPYYPHMRGWSLFLLVGYPWYLILPAHAGMILPLKTWRSKLLNITRTCGDDPQDKSHSRLNCSYYPHMRGWSHQYLRL